MKFLGINRTVTSSRGLSLSAYLGLGGAAVLAVAVSISACIPSGDCTGDCAEATVGGGSGSGGGKGGSAGSGTDILGSSVSNCNDFPTIGEVETKLIKPKCGDPSGCHGTSGAKFAPELKTANAFERLFDKATTACTNDKLVDPTDFAKSGILTKLKDTPMCTDGGDFGAKMPSGGKTTLTDADKTCLEEYVKAVIAAKKS